MEKKTVRKNKQLHFKWTDNTLSCRKKISKRCRFCLMSRSALKTQICEKLDLGEALVLSSHAGWEINRQSLMCQPYHSTRLSSLWAQQICGTVHVKGNKIRQIQPRNWKKKKKKGYLNSFGYFLISQYRPWCNRKAEKPFKFIPMVWVILLSF